MNEQIKQIAGRIRELREILDVAAIDLAKQLNLSPEEYERYENAEDDIPIGVIYGVAQRRPDGSFDRRGAAYERLHNCASGARRFGRAV